MAAKIEKYLNEVVKLGGSDLHLKVDEPPVVRIQGELKRLENYKPFSLEEIKELIFEIMTEEQIERFKKEWELDISYELPGISRFRMNVFLQRGKIGVAVRVIPLKVKTIDEWKMPEILKEIALSTHGFVLVTGPTGAGKSTTLAAMIEEINLTQKKHIVTIEDPIEYVFEDKKSVIEQRAIGVDTNSFEEALKRVMRQTPDVIMVGEMRDRETIERALNAAEMGALVFATLHTPDAPQTVDRIVDVFEPEHQHQIRVQFASTIRAVISQTLLRRKDGKGMIAAFEILIGTKGVANAIREGKVEQIYNIIKAGGQFGMKLLDDYLKDLYLRGLVDYEEALSKASNPNLFEASLARG
ncbi:MAG: type IV pilus twitching motility protein PilT [candidate division WOR-3 bacterium]